MRLVLRRDRVRAVPLVILQITEADREMGRPYRPSLGWVTGPMTHRLLRTFGKTRLDVWTTKPTVIGFDYSMLATLLLQDFSSVDRMMVNPFRSHHLDGHSC